MDNASLKSLLGLNFTSPQNPRGVVLEPILIDKILHLNQIVNPVPKNNLVLEGKETEKDPLNRLNLTALKKLIGEGAKSTF